VSDIKLSDYLEDILWEVRQEHLADDREWQQRDTDDEQEEQ
jgi:hypothetical protein